MRRIGRWMLNALTVLSLLLCVGTIGACVRSFYVTDGLQLMGAPTGSEEIWVAWHSAGVEVGFLRGLEPDSQRSFRRFSGRSFGYYGINPAEHRLLGFGTRTFHLYNPVIGGFITGWGFVFPLPLLTVLFALAPGFAIRAWVRKRRLVRSGRCARCDYDLTANVSGVCPECGTTIAEAK